MDNFFKETEFGNRIDDYCSRPDEIRLGRADYQSHTPKPIPNEAVFRATYISLMGPRPSQPSAKDILERFQKTFEEDQRICLFKDVEEDVVFEILMKNPDLKGCVYKSCPSGIHENISSIMEIRLFNALEKYGIEPCGSESKSGLIIAHTFDDTEFRVKEADGSGKLKGDKYPRYVFEVSYRNESEVQMHKNLDKWIISSGFKVKYAIGILIRFKKATDPVSIRIRIIVKNHDGTNIHTNTQDIEQGSENNILELDLTIMFPEQSFPDDEKVVTLNLSKILRDRIPFWQEQHMIKNSK